MYENGDKKRINFDFPTINLKRKRKYFIQNNKNDEDNKRLPKGIISKLLTVGLFFFIFIFCASKFGTVIAKEYDESSFNPNITYIQEKTISYYKKNAPTTVGKSTSKSLSELINAGIINKNDIPKIDECDLDKSYVSLTLNNNKTYSFIISLNCNGILEEKEEVLKNI